MAHTALLMGRVVVFPARAFFNGYVLHPDSLLTHAHARTGAHFQSQTHAHTGVSVIGVPVLAHTSTCFSLSEQIEGYECRCSTQNKQWLKLSLSHLHASAPWHTHGSLTTRPPSVPPHPLQASHPPRHNQGSWPGWVGGCCVWE